MGGHPPPMYGGPAPPGPPAYGGLAELRQFREELEKQMKDHKEEQEKARRDLEAASNILTQQMERMNLAGGGSPSPASPPGMGGSPMPAPSVRPLFGAPRVIEDELKTLFLKHGVEPEIEQRIAEKKVTSAAIFYNVGHNKESCRSSLAGLAGLNTDGEGVVPLAALLAVWRELSERYENKTENPDEAMASVMVDRSLELLSKKLNAALPPYRTPCAVSLQAVNRNYKAHKFECVDLRKMRAMGIDAFDPLSHKNRKKDCDKVYVINSEGKHVPVEEEGPELDLKCFRRAMDLYLFCELSVGNLCNPKGPGEPDHMTPADKIFYETLLQRYGFDPPPRVRMDLDLLKCNEVKLRANIFIQFKDGHTWATALNRLQADQLQSSTARSSNLRIA